MGILASEVRPSRGRDTTLLCSQRFTPDASPTQHAATLGRLCPVHRLDRNVSGLLVFARGAAAANALRLQIMVRCLRGMCPSFVA